MNEPSKVGKVAHNLGLAAWFGGTLFGQVALNPTVSSISARRERGLNESWGRCNAANAPALAGPGGGGGRAALGAGAPAREGQQRRRPGRARPERVLGPLQRGQRPGAGGD